MVMQLGCLRMVRLYCLLLKRKLVMTCTKFGWMILKILTAGMMKMMVNKAHVLGYEAGRSVTILTLPEGDFVGVVGTPEGDGQITLPEGASLRQLEIQQPWVVVLPTPTTTLWHFGMSVRSFQGPVAVPQK